MKPQFFTPPWDVVVNADQRHSRSSPDLVPGLLAELRAQGQEDLERTAGDEVQVLLRRGTALSRVLQTMVRAGSWRVGVGFGEVEEPVPSDVREARGPAFIAARSAIEAAHTSPTGITLATPAGIVTAGRYPSDEADTRHHVVARAAAVVDLLAHLWSGRSEQGWEVADLMDEGMSGQEAARRLGISASAVSQRLRTAGHRPGLQGAALLDELVKEATT